MKRCIVLLGLLGVAVVGCQSLPPLEPATLDDPPLADFHYEPQRPIAGQPVRFEAQTDAPGPSAPQTFQWTFGDESQSEGAIVMHTFAEATTYSVTLVTTNRRGRQSTLTRTVQVGAAPGVDTPQTPKPPQFPYTFGAGLLEVGVDIAPGTYRTRWPGRNCHWARLSGLDGYDDQILANGFNDGPLIVKIAPTDRAFFSEGCARWTQDLSPLRDDPSATFGEGIFVVAKDIVPGMWRSQDTGRCDWQRLRGFSGTPADILNEGFSNDTPVTVQVQVGDVGFASSQCGNWTLLNVQQP